MPRSLNLGRLWLPVVVAFLFVGAPAVVEFYTDWLWYGETGYRAVFLRSLGVKTGVGAAVFVIAFAFLAVNARGALRGLRAYQLTIPTEDGPRTIAAAARSVRLLAYGVSTLAALALAAYAAARWEMWLLFWYATPFGKPDPILGRDASFYLFRLPLLQLLQGLTKATVLLAMAVVAAGHFLAGGLGLGAQGPFASRGAIRQLSALAAVLLVSLAFEAYLEIPATLIEPSGIVHGAPNADVEARLPALRLLVVAAAAGVCLLYTSDAADE